VAELQILPLKSLLERVVTPQELCDIDKKVAEAIGVEYAMLQPAYLDRPTCFLESKREFRPSTDWNDAMFAAEKVGMWKDGLVFGKEAYTQENLYYVSQHAHGDYGYNPIGRGETGPLAICRYVLKLKGAK
jgi:hypothetical protein